MRKKDILKRINVSKIITYAVLLLVLILCASLFAKFFTKASFGANNQSITLKAGIEKYINYKISDQDKGTLLQYDVQSAIEYKTDDEQFIPVKQSQIKIEMSKIDNKYPYSVKVIAKSTEATNGKTKDITEQYRYDEELGILIINTSNLDENGELINTTKLADAKDEYVIICYYDTYTDEQKEREIQIKAEAISILSEDNILINKKQDFKSNVKENIGELTSVEYDTEEVSNGYIKSNIINKTDYNTEYKEIQNIIVSKKESQDKIWLVEDNTFVISENNQNGEKIEKELENNDELVYKETKIDKKNIFKILGEDGKLEILDIDQNIIATIDKNTETSEDGNIIINYEDNIESIIIKTSEIKNEGILRIENKKEIKNTMSNAIGIRIKTTANIYGVKEEISENNEQQVNENIVISKMAYKNKQENLIDIKDSTTKIEFNMNKNNWTNKEQNEVIFDIYLKSTSVKDNMFKNPKIKIELPDEVEKVLLGDSHLFYGEELQLNNVTLEKGENGRFAIIADIEGTQTKYYKINLNLLANIKIPATIILKKDFKNKTSNIEFTYVNNFTLDSQWEKKELVKEINLENYKDENTITTNNTVSDTRRLTRAIANIVQESNNSSNLKTEVSMYKGDKELNENDVLHEGEYIKYNIKVINTSEEDINNIKVIGIIPAGTVYGELEADYHNYMGKYKYNFDESKSFKEIEIGTLKAGETYNDFYEVRVKDLEENTANRQLQTSVDTYIGENKVNSCTCTNSIQKAEAKVFLGAFLDNEEDRWNYSLKVESQENKQVKVNIKFPKEFKLELRVQAGGQDGTYEPVYMEADSNSILTDTIETNKEYWYEGEIDSSLIKENVDNSPVILTAYATAEINNEEYKSNENRIEYESRSVSVKMTSETEGEELNYGDKIEYELTVKNNGKTNLNQEEVDAFAVDIKDYLPSEVRPISIEYDYWEEVDGKWEKKKSAQDITNIYTDEKGNRLPNVDLTINIPYNEEITIKINTKSDRVLEKTKIENNAIVSGMYIKAKKSNTVSHTILPISNRIGSQIYEEEIKEKQEGENEKNNNIVQKESEKNKYISGIVWLDENKDGQRQKNEPKISGVEVLLIDVNDTSKIANKTITNENGTYKFGNLDSEKYIVIFKYDTQKYIVTEYQKSQVSEKVNSDANSQEIKINGEAIKAGVTDIIKLNNSQENIDMGLIKTGICDLRLDKYISKVTVITAKSIKQHNYNNQKLAKVEIKSKEIEGAKVEIEYKIVITNEGEVTASPSKIIDYLPQDFEFLKEKNENWDVQNGGELVNTSLSNKKINPGESCEITLILTKTMTANTTGQYKNIAEIGEISNSFGVQDNDSTPGNKIEGEDDYSEATIIISIGTGGIIYIGIIIISIAILVFILTILNKKGKLKNKSIVKIAKLTIFAVIFSGVIFSKDNLSWSEGEIEKQLAPAKANFTWIRNSSIRNAYGSIYFLGEVNNESWGALCQNAGLYAWSGPYNYNRATGIVSNTTQDNENITRPIITLKKDNFENGVNIIKEGDNYIYGPLTVKCEVKNKPSGKEVKYSLKLSSNQKNINTFDVIDQNGVTHSVSGGVNTFSLPGEEENKFFIKINENQFSTNQYNSGLNGITLKASIEGESVKITKTSGFLHYYYRRGYQGIKTITRHPAYEYKNSTKIDAEDSESWDDGIINLSVEIEKVDADNNEIKLSDVAFVLSTKEKNVIRDKSESQKIIYFKGQINETKGYDYRNIETGENKEWTYDINEAKKFITDQLGKVVISNLKPLKTDCYTIYEYKNNNMGYNANMPLHGLTVKANFLSGENVLLSGNYQKCVITNSRTTGNLDITKLDEDTKKPLKGVKFKIRALNKEDTKSDYIIVQDENSEKKSKIEGSFIAGNIEVTQNENDATEFITDSNGKIQLYNIPMGDYIVEEIDIPNYYGYEVGDENSISWETETVGYKQKLFIKANKPNLELLLYNTNKKGYIVKKENEETYEYSDNIQNATKFFTDENGEILVNNLPADKFIIEELDKKVIEGDTIIEPYYQGEIIKLYTENKDFKFILKDKNNGQYIKSQQRTSIMATQFTYTSNKSEATKYSSEDIISNYTENSFSIEEYTEETGNSSEYISVIGRKLEIFDKAETLYKIKSIPEVGQANYYIRVFDENNEFLSTVSENIRVGSFEYTSNINEATTFVSDGINKLEITGFIVGKYQMQKYNSGDYIPDYLITIYDRYMDIYITYDQEETIRYRISRDGQNILYLRVFDENKEFVDKVVQEINVSHIEYTSNINESTEFITASNGYLVIRNLPYDVYRIEGVYEDNEIPTIIKTQYKAMGEGIIRNNGKGREIKVNVKNQPLKDTSIKSNKFESKLIVYNKRKYIKISGYAWEDNISGKSSTKNNLYDESTDKRIEGITVKLYKKDGTLLDTRITNKNGEYKFGDYVNDKKKDENGNEIPVDKIKIEDLDGAYIEFEYNGMSYETTDIVMKKDEQGKDTDLVADNSSKVVENISKNVGNNISTTREEFNSNYAIIEHNKSKNSNGDVIYDDLIYDYENYASKLKLGDNPIYGYDGQEYPVNGVYNKYKITANTYDANSSKLLGQNLTVNDIRENDIDEIQFVNLGLRRREMPDLAISTDINNVEININGYKHIFQGNNRIGTKESRKSYSENGKDENAIFNATVKAGSKYRSDSYTRELYEADYKYSGVNPFEAYVTYEIKIRNESTNLTSAVNSLVNYYDKNYLVPHSYKIDDNDSLEGIDVSSSNYNDNYNKFEIKGMKLTIDSQKEKSVMIKFKLKNYEQIIYDTTLDEKTFMLDNYTEITSYSSKKDDNVYGGIDKDSNPGNFNLDAVEEKEQKNEDDNDKAPTFKIIITGRQLQGTVFLDSLLDDKKGGPGNERQGNGIFDQGEKTIEGVKVGLYKTTDFDENGKLLKDKNGNLPKPSGETYYTSKISDDDKTMTIDNKKYYYNENGVTAEDGEFIVTDFIPGDYKLVYIWGNGKYSVEDYKGTIWTEDNVKEKYKDGNINQEEKKDWYRNQTNDENGNIIRFTDAKDNWQMREENESIMQSATNDLCFRIELNDDINSKTVISKLIDNKIKFIIPNIDLGIVERAKQSLTIDKKVESINIVLANGQTIVDAKFDKDGNIVGTTKGVNYAPAENEKTQIWISLDSELIQGANADITYKISVNNNSEKDYSNKEYYYYGKPDDDDLIKLQPEGVYDYLDSTMVFNPESNKIQDNGTWSIISQEEYNSEKVTEPTVIENYLHEKYSSENVDDSTIKTITGYETFKEIYSEAIKDWTISKIKVSRQKRLADKTILYNANLEKPIEVGGENSVLLKVSKLLSNQEEIDLNNDSEIVKIKDENNSGRRIYPIIEKLYARAENIVISTNPGRTDYTIEIVQIILSGLVIVAIGIVFVKKKFIK